MAKEYKVDCAIIDVNEWGAGVDRLTKKLNEHAQNGYKLISTESGQYRNYTAVYVILERGGSNEDFLAR